MTAPSGQSETGEVTVTDEQKDNAHRICLQLVACLPSLLATGAYHTPACEMLAAVLAARDAAAERRGAEREREACAITAASVSGCTRRGSCLACKAADAIRARSKP